MFHSSWFDILESVFWHNRSFSLLFSRTQLLIDIILRHLFSYWDSIYDQVLFNNSIALNILYILTLSDVDRDWILSSSEIRDQLYELQVKGSKKEVSPAIERS